MDESRMMATYFISGISIPTMDFELTDKIYTIDGKRVKTPTEKGIYIIGNKKVVVK